jgi:Arc/MetJ-type ribon-helix-helix transcriptional regulator
MSTAFPPELNRLIEAKMATGEYSSEAELIVDALHALDDVKARGEQLRQEIRSRLASADTDLSKPLDLEAFKAEARRRLESRKAGS